jgi:hypothetical protein
VTGANFALHLRSIVLCLGYSVKDLLQRLINKIVQLNIVLRFQTSQFGSTSECAECDEKSLSDSVIFHFPTEINQDCLPVSSIQLDQSSGTGPYGCNEYTNRSRYYKSMLESGCQGLQCLCGRCIVIKGKGTGTGSGTIVIGIVSSTESATALNAT